MDCKMDKKYWTNFDLLDAVKTISAQKGLVYTKAHFSVAEELLFQIGDLSIHSSQSEEDKKLIKNFRCKYIRVINHFKQWHNNYSGPAAQQYGMQEFCKLKQKNNSYYCHERSKDTLFQTPTFSKWIPCQRKL